MPFLFAGAKVRQLFRSAKSFTNFFHFFLLFSAFCRERAALPPQRGLKEGEGGGSRKGVRRRGNGRGRKGPAALPYLIIYIRARGGRDDDGGRDKSGREGRQVFLTRVSCFLGGLARSTRINQMALSIQITRITRITQSIRSTRMALSNP